MENLRKIVLAISNSSNKGKTSTLREIAKILIENFSPKIILPKDSENQDVLNSIESGGDFSLVLNINGVMIGIESKGDPGTSLKTRLEQLVDMGCDVIICTCRTRGDTKNDVNALKNNYSIIFSSTYSSNDCSQELLNQLNKKKAIHLIDLLQQFSFL